MCRTHLCSMERLCDAWVGALLWNGGHDARTTTCTLFATSTPKRRRGQAAQQWRKQRTSMSCGLLQTATPNRRTAGPTQPLLAHLWTASSRLVVRCQACWRNWASHAATHALKNAAWIFNVWTSASSGTAWSWLVLFLDSTGHAFGSRMQAETLTHCAHVVPSPCTHNASTQSS